MFVEALDSRRLLAATAELTAGTLRVAGTNESDRIEVTSALQSESAGPTGTVKLRAAYVVTVNQHVLGTFLAADVTRINVFGLGGRDRITGPKETSSDSVIVTRNSTGTPSPLVIDSSNTAKPAPLYAEGGSGSDFIQAFSADDTLVGGNGNDVLIGGTGRNTLNGGKGDDTFNAYFVAVAGSSGKRVVSQVDPASRNRIIGGAGRDFADLARRDTVSDDVELKGISYSLGATSARSADASDGDVFDFLAD